jgi:hypothetical protein
MADEKLTHHTGLRYTDEEAAMIAGFRAQFPGMSRNLAIRTMLRLGFRSSGAEMPAAVPMDGQERIALEEED